MNVDEREQELAPSLYCAVQTPSASLAGEPVDKTEWAASFKAAVMDVMQHPLDGELVPGPEPEQEQQSEPESELEIGRGGSPDVSCWGDGAWPSGGPVFVDSTELQQSSHSSITFEMQWGSPRVLEHHLQRGVSIHEATLASARRHAEDGNWQRVTAAIRGLSCSGADD